MELFTWIEFFTTLRKVHCMMINNLESSVNCKRSNNLDRLSSAIRLRDVYKPWNELTIRFFFDFFFLFLFWLNQISRNKIIKSKFEKKLLTYFLKQNNISIIHKICHKKNKTTTQVPGSRQEVWIIDKQKY